MYMYMYKDIVIYMYMTCTFYYFSFFFSQCKHIPYLDNLGKHDDGLNIAYSHPPAPPVPPRNYQLPNVLHDVHINNNIIA